MNQSEQTLVQRLLNFLLIVIIAEVGWHTFIHPQVTFRNNRFVSQRNPTPTPTNTPTPQPTAPPSSTVNPFNTRVSPKTFNESTSLGDLSGKLGELEYSRKSMDYEIEICPHFSPNETSMCGDHPQRFAILSQTNGHFRLADIPSGEYVMAIYIPSAKEWRPIYDIADGLERRFVIKGSSDTNVRTIYLPLDKGEVGKDGQY